MDENRILEGILCWRQTSKIVLEQSLEAIQESFFAENN